MDRENLATQRAEEYAPMPAGGALMAGVCVAVVAILIDVAVSAFYGWQVRDNISIAVVLAVAGFLIGFLGHQRLSRRHRKARGEELHQINIERDGQQ
jgi:membrane associated rhomboid family serine protease